MVSAAPRAVTGNPSTDSGQHPLSLALRAGGSVSRYGLLAVGALWLISVVRVDIADMGSLGLLSALPLTWFLGLALLTVSFAAALTGPIRRWVMLAHLAMLLLYLIATGPAVYEVARYEWAWKHMGVVDFIARTGGVDRDIHALEVYHHWPGFFSALAAWVGLAGLEDARQLALWAPVFFQAAILGVIWMVVSHLTDDARLRWLSLWLYLPINWVGQDYLSPQAVGYLLHWACLALVLGFLSRDPCWPEPWRFRQRFGSLEGDAATVSLVLMAVFSLGLAVTHQLTPFALMLSLAALALVGGQRTVWLAAVVAVMTAFWAFTFAWPYVGESLRELAEGAGRPVDNVKVNELGSALSTGQRVVSISARVATVTAFALAAGGVALAWRRRRPTDRIAGALLVAAVLMLGLNGYGGEIVFRVVLFAAPMLAYFIARALLTVGSGSLKRIAMVATSGLLVALFLLAYYGRDQYYSFTRAELEAAEWVYDQGVERAGTLLIEPTAGQLRQLRNYEQFVYVPITLEGPETVLDLVEDPVGLLELWMGDDRYADSIFVVTRTDRAEQDALGVFPEGGLESVTRTLRSSSAFEVAFENEDAVAFRLADGAVR